MNVADFDAGLGSCTIFLEGRELILTKEYETVKLHNQDELRLTARRYVEARYPHRFQATLYFSAAGCQCVESGYMLPGDDDLAILMAGYESGTSIPDQHDHRLKIPVGVASVLRH